jgi:REP element-mobilizing transposase RayT
MTRTRYKFVDDQYPHFITDTVVAWLPIFSQPKFAQIVFDSWAFLQSQRQIQILAYVVMENHLHWIAVGPDLGKRVGEFKSFTATSIIKQMKLMNYETQLEQLKYYRLQHKTDQEHQLWQEGSHPKIIESDSVLWQKIDYIHNNPLKRGYVDDPAHWRYSSARNYQKLPSMIEICTDWV